MNDAYILFKKGAERLYLEDGVDYQEKGNAVVDLMADRYCAACDSGDEAAKDKYISGLMMRFWYTVGKTMMKSATLPLDFDDYVMMVYEALEYACKYRAWQPKILEDGTKVPPKIGNASTAIHQCIETIRLQYHYDYNLDKHRANWDNISMDTPIDSEEKSTIGDTLVDEDYEDTSNSNLGTSAAISMVQTYINRNKLVEAIILDTIAFNDVQKTTKQTVKDLDIEGNPRKYTKVYKEFWPYRCVQILSTLPADYATYFNRKYMVNAEEFDAALSAVRKANNQKLYRFLDRTLTDARGVFSR
jgi:hypothetical protein